MTNAILNNLGTSIGLKYDFTDEQTAVIDLSRDGVHLVLAGAGSGKTDTMSARAVWLIASGDVRPDQILGLTFTRKAARALAERFRVRIDALRYHQDKFAKAGLPITTLADDEHGLDVPTVSTYNSFASQIFTENAARIGWDADSPVITDATAFGIAREVVLASTDERLGNGDYTVENLTRATITLAAELREFEVTDDDKVIDYAKRVAALATLPQRRATNSAETRKKLTTVGALEFLIPLARAFIEEKRRRRVVEFSDQIVFAREILTAFPEVGAEYRERFKVVILDEYQDTSFSQTSLFSTLFGSSRVTAVGDPNQSIYSWRGASPTNVASFHDDFNVPEEQRGKNTLLMSWRNGLRILAAANTILDHREEHLPLNVDRLEPKKDATEFRIGGTFAASTRVEAERLAEWFTKILADHDAQDSRDENGRPLPPPTMAMLVRTRTHLDYFLDEFDRRKVKYRLLGVAGILRNPFVADLYCALSVIAEPARGARLVRLLGGARWQVSVDDLWSLHNHARTLAKEFMEQGANAHLGSSLVADEADSLVDALDSLRGADRARVEHESGNRVKFSDRGWAALVDAAEFFHNLRRHIDLGIPDVVAMTATALHLDIEARATGAHQAGAHREAFDELVHSYLSIPTDHSLRGFVDWVSDVEKREKKTPATDEPEPGVVQVLTIHASKGLEWDVVAVPRCTEGPPNQEDVTKAEKAGTPVIPSRGDLSRSANEAGWLQLGALPHVFRPDLERSPLFPRFHWDVGATLLDDVVAASQKYTDALKKSIIIPEERRLMYVAVTRARDHLWVSGSWFEGPGSTVKAQSTYLRELLAAEYTTRDGKVTGKLLDDFLVDPQPMSNPDGAGRPVTWPAIDPLGSAERRERYEVAAALFAAHDEPAHPDDLDAIEHLLARDADQREAPLPIRIPASRYAEWAMDLGHAREGARRPVPSQPYVAARVGTQVHSWIEIGAYDDDSQIDGIREADEVIENDAHLAVLQQKFATSRWATLRAEAHELEILLPSGDHVIVCKIDAVYLIDGRWTVVDWKTGAKPETEEEKDAKAMQLVLYRRALAALKGISVDEVDAVLYYIAHDWDWTIERERLDRLDALAPIG